MDVPTLDDWIALIRSFSDGLLPPDDFDTAYFSYYRRAIEEEDSQGVWIIPEDAAPILDDFFVEVDCLSNDPEQFPGAAITADELRTTARRVVTELEAIRRR